MEEIINSVMQSPENTNPNVLRGQLQKMGGSSGGVLMVTNTNGTLDKTMGEIQDAYLSGKRVIISHAEIANDVIGLTPIVFKKGEYIGNIRTYDEALIDESNNLKIVLVPWDYVVFGKTEEATRNAYPAHLE